MEDYKLPSMPDLIEKLRPTAHTDALASLRLLRLNALFVYFQYSVAAVRLQEASIKAMEGGQDKNFSTHDEYEDCLLKLYSPAINAYSHLRTCLHFARGRLRSYLSGLPPLMSITFGLAQATSSMLPSGVQRPAQ